MPSLINNIASAAKAFAEVINHADQESFKFEAVTPEDLALVTCAFALLHKAPGRPMLVETWRGPGVYEVALECGASQSMDWDKLDDLEVVCRRTGA